MSNNIPPPLLPNLSVVRGSAVSGGRLLRLPQNQVNQFFAFFSLSFSSLPSARHWAFEATDRGDFPWSKTKRRTASA
jgi:hypothetical protein